MLGQALALTLLLLNGLQGQDVTPKCRYVCRVLFYHHSLHQLSPLQKNGDTHGDTSRLPMSVRSFTYLTDNRTCVCSELSSSSWPELRHVLWASLRKVPVVSSLEASAPANCTVALAGTPLWLRPPSTQTMARSVEWKVKLFSKPGVHVIVTWSNASGSDTVSWFSSNISNRLRFMTKDFTLLINTTQLQDSGFYCLEVTYESGAVWSHELCVSVFDQVEKPRVLEQWKALDRGKCQVTLSCSVSRGGNVSYAWYRGSKLIPTARNLTFLEEQIDPKDMHTYTCQVSNPVSWANQTLRLTQGCLSAQQKFSFLPFLVAIVLLITLSLGALGCFFVHRRKRKQSEHSPEGVLTIYEEVNNLPIRRNHEQSPHGEGNTIYSRVQSQPPASTSQVMEKTLYSMVQLSQKSGSKKRSHRPSFNSTIYEEVGRRQPRAHSPARLSQKELQNFHVYC